MGEFCLNDKDSTIKSGNDGSSGLFPTLNLYAVVCLLLFALLFHSSYQMMMMWWQGEDFNYCFFVPLIVLYLLWEKRAELRSVPFGPSWIGIAPLLFGISLFWLGELAGEYYTIYIGSWFVLIGCIWAATGWRWLKLAAFPLLFLISMFPFPTFINNNLTFQLKLLSSALAVKILQLCGMSIHREGNLIDLGVIQLQVVDACSGIRYFYPLIVLSILLAYFFRSPFWKRVLLVLSTAPVSVISNAMRIASTAVLCRYCGEEFALGFFHDFSGWFIFMCSLGMLLLEMRLLKTVLPDPPREKPMLSVVPPSVRTPGFKAFLPQFVFVTLLLATNVILSHDVDFRHKTPLHKPLAGFPLRVSDWRGGAVEMDKFELNALKFDDYIMIHYVDRLGKEIDFYTVYYGSQVKGESIHSPASCFPGNGWVFKESGVVAIPLGKEKGELRVRRAVAENVGGRELVYYWFPQRGRILTDLYQLKFYVFWDALTRRRTDGAMVRIITPLYASEQTADAEVRLQGFAREIAPVLEQFLPR
jgi:exosortase D (VPLPA-CTERM-specific)